MDTPEAPPGAKPRLVTVDQIVARNLAWYRRKAQMTQQEVADCLGWTSRAVSEAERSWESGRTREFNAHLLASLAMILGVPIGAFFLPPADTDSASLYFTAPDGDPVNMAGLLWLVMPDNDDDSGALTAYRDRFRDVTAEFLDPQWRKEVARWFRQNTSAAETRDRADLLRSRAARIRESGEDAAGDLEALADEMDKAAGDDDA